jgi:hypothetical protein
VPGFLHRKGEPFLTRLASKLCHDGEAYTLAEIVGTLGLEIDPGDPTASGSADDFDRAIMRHSITAETIDHLRSALAALADEQAINREPWIKVGLALASIKTTDFEDEARELWHQFSDRPGASYAYDDA